MIRGIGPIYASRLVATFGDQVFEVIEPVSIRPIVASTAMLSRTQGRLGSWPDRRLERGLDRVALLTG
ncbi:hypothetical protein KQ304_00750 [Synechococcus sp. CS-1329]|uniref:hypothetical protein n=1 Tax=Synechococcus sp. CS-1329 TaxID=2847975 RepID=UPI0028807C9E|nr:hypothetical protein [Synechococcus sp. CS-1329]MCT0217533.1 hypothetical protein [Synechococcus sp. CS-1329]